jgi:dTDP-4-dehydrorhamnose reductase
MRILVTGKNGQLGTCMQDSAKMDKDNEYFFYDRKTLDITDKSSIDKVFDEVNPDFVINCAAYTNVKAAEENTREANLINCNAVENLTNACGEHNCYLVHISTDYVFDGKKKIPYCEQDIPRPLNQYGQSKLLGEDFVVGYKKGIVIRTSWLYSEYGKNFYRIMSERIHFCNKTKVVNDQIGTPTYAKDLSNFIVGVLLKDKEIEKKCGLYHFSGNGQASWYDFASAIEMLQKYVSKKYEKIDDIYILPTTTKEYWDTVHRAKYSVLDNRKIEKTFDFKNKHWIYSLLECMKNDNEL